MKPSAQIARIVAAVEKCEAANSPITAGVRVCISSAKPESKEPGREGCPQLMRQVDAILTRTLREITAAYDATDIREPRSVAPDSIGDHVTDTEETIRAEVLTEPVTAHHRTTRIEVRQHKLVAKYAE